jgi:spore coat polysaccharide biosynthesis protein SpsF
MKQVVAIIQARMSSTRLPGKVLKEACGRPLLWHLIYRLRKAGTIEGIVLATSRLDDDKILMEKAREWGVKAGAGSPDDLLDRYYQAAREFNADPIVRITADCPLIDPRIVDQVVGEFLKLKDYDHVGTDGTFPDGLDTGVYSFRAIEKAWREAKLPSEREHVGPYIGNHPELFRNKAISYRQNLSHLRWTVDQEEDLMLVREIFGRLFHEGEMFYTEDILKLLEQEPRLLKINSHITRNEGYLKSLAHDEEYLRRIDAKAEK